MKTFVKLTRYNGKPALHQPYLDINEYLNFNPEINHQNNEKI